MKDFIFICFLIILGALVFYVFLYILFTQSKKKWKNKFNKLIYNKLKNGLLYNQYDVHTIFKAFVSEMEDSTFFYKFTLSLVEMLENFVLSADDLEEKEKNLIMSFIQKEMTLIPFDGVPTEERIILTTICNNLNEKKDASLIDNLKQLGVIMSTRYYDYKRIEKRSKRSFNFAIISTISTIIGIIFTILQHFHII